MSCPICGHSLTEVIKGEYICPNYPNHPPAIFCPICNSKQAYYYPETGKGFCLKCNSNFKINSSGEFIK